MNAVNAICLVLLFAAALLALIRVGIGPTTLDRMVALEVIAATVITAFGAMAAAWQNWTLLTVIAVMSLLSFVGSVTVARFSAKERE